MTCTTPKKRKKGTGLIMKNEPENLNSGEFRKGYGQQNVEITLVI